MVNSVGKAHSREIGLAEASIHSIISLVVSSKLHAVIESPAAGRQDQQGVLNLFPVTGDSPGTKVSWTRLPGLAAVLSLSPSVAIAGPLEKPVRSASCEGEKNKWTAFLLKNCR